MKIAVNTRLLLPGKLEGIGWFTRQTFSHIVQNHPGVEFTFFFDRDYSSEFVFSDNVKPVVLFPQARHPFLYYLFFEQAIPRFLKKNPHDLFISPDGLLSLNYPGKQIPVFHDLNFIHHPKNLPWLSSRYYNYMFPRYAARSTRIATVSQYSREDIIKSFKYPADKIDVVYNGVNPVFKPLSQQEVMEVRKRYTGSSPYFVYVGALHKRKNIRNMLKAFDQFKSDGNSDFKLLIVGQPMFGSDVISKAFASMSFRQDVIFAGRLYEEELRKVVAASHALLLVSFFEGFGIPIIEAMKCDVPVITSNTTSMPEVAGEGALLVEPSSVDSIVQAMRLMTRDTQLHSSLIEKGREVCRKFSWEQTAERMWHCIEKSLQ